VSDRVERRTTHATDEPTAPDDPPPFLGRWANLYALVLLLLLAIILALLWVTRIFA
jgi:hypothetical protein